MVLAIRSNNSTNNSRNGNGNNRIFLIARRVAGNLVSFEGACCFAGGLASKIIYTKW